LSPNICPLTTFRSTLNFTFCTESRPLP